MTRKEMKTEGGRTVIYLIEKDINVSVIISELSSMGCKGEELGNAYKTLISDNKGYTYENKETREKLLVIDAKSLKASSSMPLIWLFFMAAMLCGSPFGDPSDGFIRELKKGGEEIK